MNDPPASPTPESQDLDAIMASSRGDAAFDAASGSPIVEAPEAEPPIQEHRVVVQPTVRAIVLILAVLILGSVAILALVLQNWAASAISGGATYWVGTLTLAALGSPNRFKRIDD